MSSIKSVIELSKVLHEVMDVLRKIQQEKHGEPLSREDIDNMLEFDPSFIDPLRVFCDFIMGHDINRDDDDEHDEEVETDDEADIITEEEDEEDSEDDDDNEDEEESVTVTNEVEECNDKTVSDLNKYTRNGRIRKKKCSRHLTENEIDSLLDGIISVDGMTRLKARDYLDKKYPSIGKRRIVDLLTGRTYGEKTNGLISIDMNDIVHINKPNLRSSALVGHLDESKVDEAISILKESKGDIAQIIKNMDGITSDEIEVLLATKCALAVNGTFQKISEEDVVLMIAVAIKKSGKRKLAKVINYVRTTYGVHVTEQMIFPIINKEKSPELTKYFFV